MWLQISQAEGAIFRVFRFIEKTRDSLFISSSPHRERILTIYKSYDVFPRKAVPFWGRVDTASQIVVEIPQNINFEA